MFIKKIGQLNEKKCDWMQPYLFSLEFFTLLTTQLPHAFHGLPTKRSTQKLNCKNLIKHFKPKNSLSKPGLVMLSHVRPGLSNKVSLSGGSLAELLEQLPWCHANPRTLWVWLQLLHRLSSDIWRLEGAGSLLKSWFQSLKMLFACLRFSLGMKWNTMKWYEFALRQLPLSYQHCQASLFSIDDSDSILCLAWEQFELHLTVGSKIW